MRIIEWHLETGMQGGDRTGKIEVEDNATEEQIEQEVREDVFNFISWSWNRKTSLLDRQEKMGKRNDAERLLNAAMDHIAGTLEQPGDPRAWDHLLIYCPRAALERRLERLNQQINRAAAWKDTRLGWSPCISPTPSVTEDW